MENLLSAHLNVTLDCNFRCQYCFVSHKPQTMTIDTARSAVDWLAAHRAGHKPLAIEFFGGEPLLNWPVVQAAIEYAEQQYPGQFSFGMVTNCMLLTPERLGFLQAHNVGVLASYDGIKSHDVMRAPDTAGQVTQAIRDMLAAGIKVSTAMSLPAGQTQHLYENFLSHAALGVRGMAINQVTTGYRPYDEDDWWYVDAQYDLIVEWLLQDRLTHNGRPTMHCALLEKHLSGIKAKALKQQRNRSDWACGACRGSLGIWPDGTITPCHQTDQWRFPHWVLGHVTSGELNSQRRNEYLVEKYLDCNDCEVTNCGHCRVRSFEATGCETAYVEDSCRYQRLLYEKAIKLWNGLVQAGVDMSKVG